MVIPAARTVLQLLSGLGRYSILLFMAFKIPRDVNVRLYARNLSEQMVRIGVESIPIVALSTAFLGGVAAVQSLYQLNSPFLPTTLVGSFTEQTVMLELASLVMAFVLSGRVGARIAAELGTMRVTEQIDALEAMGINSRSYLIVPRVAAGVLTFPMLYVIACGVGLAAGALVAAGSPELTTDTFWVGAREFFKPYDAFFGLIKATIFGFIITSVSCYKGYFTTGGAEGVGSSTTQATVVSCVFVLLADYVLAVVLL